MKFSMLENAKYVPAIVPLNITGAATDGDLVAVKNCEAIYIVLQAGAWAGGTSAITVTQETSASGSANTAVAFTKKWSGTALTDDVLAEDAVTSNTFTIGTANTFHIIEIRPESLASGSTHIRVRSATPGSNNDYLSAFYVLTGITYQQQYPLTAIA